MPDKAPTTRPAITARANAVNRLIDAHSAEFEDYMAEACADLGIAYTRKPTAEDAAREKIDALLAKHPSLRAEYGPLGVNEKYAPSGLDEFATTA